MKFTKQIFKMVAASVSGTKLRIERLRDAGFTGKTVEHYEHSVNKPFSSSGKAYQCYILINKTDRTYRVAKYNESSYDRAKAVEIRTWAEFQELIGTKTKLYEIF